MKVFWSRCGHGYGNFGDKLTPLFLDYYNLRYDWALPEDADLVGIGSLMEKIPATFSGAIWTAGNMFKETRKTLAESEVFAVRGKLTLERLQCRNKESVILGDGGLICDLFYQPEPKKFRLGLVPHFADQGHPIVSQLALANPDITVIDVCGPTLEVIQRIGQCEVILSSSLHGLIVADSLGVPSQWIELDASAVSGAGFKFRDYYSNFDLHDVYPRHLRADDAVEGLSKIQRAYARPGIADLKGRLRENLADLIKRFGGDRANTVSLAELRKKERRGAEEFHQWNERVGRTVFALENAIPTGERFLLIDEEQIRHAVTHATAVRFLERDGEYWGSPVTNADAMRELHMHLQSGIRFIALIWAAFWWLDEFPGFKSFLVNSCDPLVSNADVRIFHVR